MVGRVEGNNVHSFSDCQGKKCPLWLNRHVTVTGYSVSSLVTQLVGLPDIKKWHTQEFYSVPFPFYGHTVLKFIAASCDVTSAQSTVFSEQSNAHMAKNTLPYFL